VLDVLPRLEAEIPKNATMVVYHAMTAHHLREDGKEEGFQRLLEAISTKRPVVEAAVEWTRNVSNHHTGPTPVHVAVTEWRSGHPNRQIVAETDSSADGAFLKFL
jgi:hypothetical protein